MTLGLLNGTNGLMTLGIKRHELKTTCEKTLCLEEFINSLTLQRSASRKVWRNNRLQVRKRRIPKLESRLIVDTRYTSTVKYEWREKSTSVVDLHFSIQMGEPPKSENVNK